MTGGEASRLETERKLGCRRSPLRQSFLMPHVEWCCVTVCLSEEHQAFHKRHATDDRACPRSAPVLAALAQPA
jgi:hypothetical protein